MNANRMRYSTTPTYGMQKRGFLKKTAKPVRQAPEAPDFSQVPDPSAGYQQPFAQPVQAAPVYMPPLNTPASAPVWPGIQQPMPQPVNGAYGMPFGANQNAPYGGVQPSIPGTTQIPMAAPTFVPSMGGVPLSAAPMQAPPLGNSAPAMNSVTPFSLRGQGYVPPAQPAAPTVQNAAQPAIPFGQPQAPAYAAPQSVPMMNGGYNAAFPPQSPAAPAQPQPQAQPAYQPAAPKAPRQPMSTDKLLSVFLFGLLPLLFIPCIFVPSSLDFIRYAFLGLCVAGLGAMWYRQMYSSVARLIVSMVYVALCIVCIAMMMQGSADTRRLNAPAEPASAVTSPAPEENSDLSVVYPQESPALMEPTPTPEGMSASQAQKRLETFMTLWASNNVSEMVSLVQPSWCSAQENPSTALFMVLSNRTPEDFNIEEVGGTEQDNSRTITMTATINKNTGKAASVYRFMVMMVKEGEEWYVNPNSLATNEKEATTDTASDENVVNNRNATGNVTEPPRTTVTPAPPASTTLYYNPNGGSYYHMDAYCPSVKDEYLPLTGTFAYRELGTYKSQYNLTPCLRCSAPVNTLPPEE